MACCRLTAAAALAAAFLGSTSVSAFTPQSTRAFAPARTTNAPIWSTVVDAPDAEKAAAEPAKKKKPNRNSRRKKGGSKSTKAGPTMTVNGKTTKNGKKGPKQGKRSKRGGGPNRNRKSMLNNGSKTSKERDLLPLSALSLGQTITGYVAAITDFGAFVKTEYRLKDEGKNPGYALLHISQISNERVDDVSDVLEVGQELEGLRVTDINYAKGEVGLSLRPRRPNTRFPLSVVRKGDEMEGKISSVMPYGAFVDVGCKKVNALLHKSRISTEEVDDVSDFVKEGQFVKVRIIDVDLDKRTMACSMLDKKADDYMDRRKRQFERRRESEQRAERAAMAMEEGDDDALRTELAYFEDALKELENAFK